MTMGNVLRIMEEKDLFDVPNARKCFEENSRSSNYFFFVIENENKEVIGYLIAKREGCQAIITEFEVEGNKKEKELYKNTAISNLYTYIRGIRD